MDDPPSVGPRLPSPREKELPPRRPMKRLRSKSRVPSDEKKDVREKETQENRETRVWLKSQWEATGGRRGRDIKHTVRMNMLKSLRAVGKEIESKTDEYQRRTEQNSCS